MKKISGGTAFYDGMWTTLDLLRRVKDSRKAIVVLTDGVDESLLDSGYERSDHSFEELLARVSERGPLGDGARPAILQFGKLVNGAELKITFHSDCLGSNCRIAGLSPSLTICRPGTDTPIDKHHSPWRLFAALRETDRGARSSRDEHPP